MEALNGIIFRGKNMGNKKRGTRRGEKDGQQKKIRHLSFSQFAPIFSQRGHLALEAHSLTSSVGRDNSDFSRFSDFELVLRG